MTGWTSSARVLSTVGSRMCSHARVPGWLCTASLLRMAQVPQSYWGDPDPRLWFQMAGCKGRHFFVDGTPHLRGRMYAWCPDKQVVTRVSKSEITICSDEAGYFMRGYLSGSEPAPPTDAEGMLVGDQADIDSWLRAVERWRLTGEWPDGA